MAVKMTRVERSSNISHLGFSDGTQELFVLFHRKEGTEPKVYAYGKNSDGVSPDRSLYADLWDSESKGTFMNENVKGHFPWRIADQSEYQIVA